LYAPFGLRVSTKYVCLSILTVCLLIPRLDVLRCEARDVLFSIALHEVRLKNSMLMQLSIGLYFTSFISITVLRLGLNGSVDSDAVFNLLLHCRKLETMSKSSVPVHFVSRLRWI
jgi:hypothetical protein